MSTVDFAEIASAVSRALVDADDTVCEAFEPHVNALADWQEPLRSDADALAALKLMLIDDGFMSRLQETMHARLVEYFEARVLAG